MVGRFHLSPSVIILFIVFNNSTYTASIVPQLAITETLLITTVGLLLMFHNSSERYVLSDGET